MPREPEDIIRDIIERQEEILSNLNQESISGYVTLKKMYNEGNIQNQEFRSLFKQYYGLNQAQLGEDWENGFFELLSERTTDLEYILSELYEIPRLNGQKTIQFVFTTKLIHTINNSKPIYDSKVGKVIEKKVEGDTKQAKIESCKEIYRYLEELYSELLRNVHIREVISRFREMHQVNEDAVGDRKVLDFIIWSLGDIL